MLSQKWRIRTVPTPRPPPSHSPLSTHPQLFHQSHKIWKAKPTLIGQAEATLRSLLQKDASLTLFHPDEQAKAAQKGKVSPHIYQE